MCQRGRGRIPCPPSLVVRKPDVDDPGQECARRQNHIRCVELDPELRDNTTNAITGQDDVVDGLLKDRQIRLVFQTATDGCAIEGTVGLGTGSPDRGSFAAVEDPKLDAGFVCGDCHRTAQRIYLPDEMTFPDTSDRRVARHLPERFDTVSEQQRAPSHPRRSERRLGAGMSAANHDDIETFGITHVDSLSTGAK